MSNYSVFIGATPTVIDVSSKSTMAEVRDALGSKMSSDDRFLYMNPVTGLKTVLTPQSAEETAKLSICAFPAVPSERVYNQIVQVVSVSDSTPSFMGTKPSDGYLRNNNLFGVRVRLNQTDEDAIQNNEGMFEPVMLANVTSCNPNDPANFTYCVICQKGAIIEFDLSCWGAAGWGYTITSSMYESSNICGSPLYINYSDSYDKQTYTVLRRYNSSSADTIQIQANAALHISSEYNVEYSTITFNAWNVTSWKSSDGKTHSSNTPIPSLVDIEADALVSEDQTSGGSFQPGPPAGGSSIPGGTTQPATPTAGPPSNQTFGSIYDVKPDGVPATRSEGLIGSLQVYFLVFDSQEDANTVIKILNSGTMGFGN